MKRIFQGSYSIKFEMREDGGIHIWSDDIPGLILSGPDPKKYFNGDIWEVICDLIEHNVERKK